MLSALFHIHKRKVRRSKLQPYPHPKLSYRLLDFLVYAISTIAPILTLPQIYLIYAHKNASGLSTVSWATYFISSIIWSVYGWIHQDKPLIITNFVWVILNAVILVGILIYS